MAQKPKLYKKNPAPVDLDDDNDEPKVVRFHYDAESWAKLQQAEKPAVKIVEGVRIHPDPESWNGMKGRNHIMSDPKSFVKEVHDATKYLPNKVNVHV
jgi:hypothetical protein